MNREHHIAVEGYDANLAISNIICHLDTLLTDDEKASINWHPHQSVSLAIMRIIDKLQREGL